MKSILERDFVYVPAKDQTVEYLREKFDAIRARIEAERKAANEKVSEIKPRMRAKA